MALACNMGLTDKVVSERHYYTSLHKMTAGEAAKIISKTTHRKISAKDVRTLYELLYGQHMEWHHSGFYKDKYGQTMGRTYFISSEDMQEIIKNIDTLLQKREEVKEQGEEVVFAFYWCWEKRNNKYIKTLKTYEGKRINLPKNATICEKDIYIVATKAEGRIYTGWDVPMISDFAQ